MTQPYRFIERIRKRAALMPAYEDLMGHMSRVQALSQVAGLLSWDQEVMMPPKGATARAEQAGALEGVSHGLRTDPRVGEWLAALEDADLDEVQTANLRLIRRAFDRDSKVPAALAEELARTTARAQGV
ncbi:MAG: hypothetical protein AAF764_04490, partial [Pseudomonadota bacterium]